MLANPKEQETLLPFKCYAVRSMHMYLSRSLRCILAQRHVMYCLIQLLLCESTTCMHAVPSF